MSNCTGKNCHTYALLRCLSILNTWGLLYLRELTPPGNWKDLKLDGETAGTKILFTEGERVWNKLPTNDSNSEKSFLATSLCNRKFKLKTFSVFVILSRNCLYNLCRLRALLQCSQNWIKSFLV